MSKKLSTIIDVRKYMDFTVSVIYISEVHWHKCLKVYGVEWYFHLWIL